RCRAPRSGRGSSDRASARSCRGRTAWRGFSSGTGDSSSAWGWLREEEVLRWLLRVLRIAVQPDDQSASAKSDTSCACALDCAHLVYVLHVDHAELRADGLSGIRKEVGREPRRSQRPNVPPVEGREKSLTDFPCIRAGS